MSERKLKLYSVLWLWFHTAKTFSFVLGQWGICPKWSWLQIGPSPEMKVYIIKDRNSWYFENLIFLVPFDMIIFKCCSIALWDTVYCTSLVDFTCLLISHLVCLWFTDMSSNGKESSGIHLDDPLPCWTVCAISRILTFYRTVIIPLSPSC